MIKVSIERLKIILIVQILNIQILGNLYKTNTKDKIINFKIIIIITHLDNINKKKSFNINLKEIKK